MRLDHRQRYQACQNSEACGEVNTGKHAKYVGTLLRRRGGLESHVSDSSFTLDRALAQFVASVRPTPLRAFDQIPMRTEDLARQGRRVARLLSGKRVVFIGDMDGTASFLGLLAAAGGPAPAKLLVLDFDVRVLEAALLLADRYGYANILETRLYNCFDPPPLDLLGKSDWFYTNPPYGSCNQGASARLFITRGCELVRPQSGAGCLILPDDTLRLWTRQAMIATQRFLHAYGWAIRNKVDNLHRYHLDDDPELSSSLILIEGGRGAPMPFAGRSVGADEIPNFYGRMTLPPYPRSISSDGSLVGAVTSLQKVIHQT